MFKRRLPNPKVLKLAPKHTGEYGQCQLPKLELVDIGYKGYREARVRKSGRNAATCMRDARWVVDGVKLCTQHAGMKVLEALCASKG